MFATFTVMTRFKWLIFFSSVLGMSLTSSTYQDEKCNSWSKEHITKTNERQYTNYTPYIIKFNQFSDLNLVCSKIRFKDNFLYVEFFPSKELLIENDLDLRKLLNLFHFKDNSKMLIFQRVKGFNQMFNSSSIANYLGSFVISFFNTKLNFFINNTISLTRENCIYKNFNKQLTNYFGSMERVVFTDTTFFIQEVCPYVFMNTNLKTINFDGISNSFMYKNQLKFINVNDSNDIYLNIKGLDTIMFYFNYEHLTEANMNILIFRNIKVLILRGIVHGIHTELLGSLKVIESIILGIHNWRSFFQSGTKWMNYLNKDIKVNLSSISVRKNILNKVKLIEMLAPYKIFGNTYDYPNEDICLFKDFPHNQLVYPVIQLDKETYTCSCTLIWLIQFSKIYLNKDLSYYDVNIQVVYPVDFKKFSARNCFLYTDLGQLVRKCNFEERFKNCQIKNHTPSFIGYMSTKQMFKLLQFITEVFIKPMLSLIGIITNTLTIIVVRNKDKMRNFKRPMYKHMVANAFFNLIFCIVKSISLVNICIYPRTSFCSTIYKKPISQYVKIYGINFFGEAIRFCCNFSYFTFSISRFSTSTSASTKWKFMKKFENMKLKYFFSIIFSVGILLNLFKIFEFKKTELYSTVDIAFPFNAYDIEY